MHVYLFLASGGHFLGYSDLTLGGPEHSAGKLFKCKGGLRGEHGLKLAVQEICLVDIIGAQKVVHPSWGVNYLQFLRKEKSFLVFGWELYVSGVL